MVNQTENVRFVAYLRDSGGTDQELSVIQQELEVRNYCRQRGWTITKMYKDEARSGKSTAGREQFLEMVRYLQSGGSGESGCIIWEYARLARDIDTAQLYKADLRLRGYVIISIKDNVPEGTDGRLLESIIDWKNQKYLDDLSANVKRGLAFIATVHRGYPSGKLPKGYLAEQVQIGKRRDGEVHYVRRLVPDESVSGSIKLAFQMRAKGMGYKEIHNATGLFKTKQLYSHMFRNPIYTGTLSWRGLNVEGFCEPIVDADLFRRVQKINEKNRERLGIYHPRSAGSAYLLSGMMVCSKCGKSVVVAIDKTAKYYTCSSKWRYDGRCGSGIIKIEKLDDIVLDVVRSIVTDEENLARIQARLIERLSGVSEETKLAKGRLNKELGQVRGKIKNLVSAIADYGHSKEMLEDLGKLTDREQEIVEELHKYMDEVEMPRTMAAVELKVLGDYVWDSLCRASLRDKQLLLRSMIKVIRLEMKNGIPAGQIEFKELPGVGEVDQVVSLQG